MNWNKSMEMLISTKVFSCLLWERSPTASQLTVKVSVNGMCQETLRTFGKVQPPPPNRLSVSSTTGISPVGLEYGGQSWVLVRQSWIPQAFRWQDIAYIQECIGLNSTQTPETELEQAHLLYSSGQDWKPRSRGPTMVGALDEGDHSHYGLLVYSGDWQLGFLCTTTTINSPEHTNFNTLMSQRTIHMNHYSVLLTEKISSHVCMNSVYPWGALEPNSVFPDFAVAFYYQQSEIIMSLLSYFIRYGYLTLSL